MRYRGYVYDTETGLYYLQSRYYNPELGRFINADMSVSTGQGILGNNMFAYCLNNPVNGSDPCGTCFHRLDFWNDCDDCGGKTLGEKLNNIATGIYDYATDVYDAHMMQNEWQRQVDETSFRSVRDSAVVIGEAIAEGIDNMNEAEYQTNQAQHTVIVDRFSTPVKTATTLTALAFSAEVVSDLSAKVGLVKTAAVLKISARALTGLAIAITWLGEEGLE